MMQAMIFAAGKGTRLKPLTDTMPKAMVSVGGQPLIRRVATKLIEAGAEKIVVNVHHFANQIVDYIAENHGFDINISISDETEALLETGGGIKKAAPLFCPDDPILIHNVDILSNVNLKKFYAMAQSGEANGQVDVLLLVSERKTKRYLLFDDQMRLCGWTNIETGEVRSPYLELDPAKCRKYAFSGIHVFSPRLFPLMAEWPDCFGIIDFYLQACANTHIMGYVKPDLRLMDIGKLDTLAQAEDFLNRL